MMGWLCYKYLDNNKDADPVAVFSIYLWIAGFFCGLFIAAWVLLFKLYDN